jgi:hypothetical protein
VGCEEFLPRCQPSLISRGGCGKNRFLAPLVGMEAERKGMLLYRSRGRRQPSALTPSWDGISTGDDGTNDGGNGERGQS